MKVLRVALFALTWAVAVAAGLYLVVASATVPRGRGGLEERIERRPEVAAPAGILIVGIALLAAMSLRARTPGAEELVYGGEGGEVRIRMGALREYVARLAGGLTGVETVRCHATREGDRVRIELTCRLPVGRSAVEYARQIQSLIRRRLSDEIGITEIGEVCLHVTGFVTPNGRNSETVDGSPEVG